MKIVFCIHLLATAYLFGLIWFVQLVHYPLMAHISPADFVSYERLHTLRTGWVVAPMMLAELFSGLYLLALGFFSYPDKTWFLLSLIALLIIWLSTFFIQVPLHQALSEQHDFAKISRLVQTNWLRTFLWSFRAIVLGALLWKMI